MPLCAGLSLVATLLLTRVYIRYALRRRLLDVPNARSSHIMPTPRGGGLAIVVVASAALAVSMFLGWVDADVASALIVGSTAVAVVGFIDDRRPVRPAMRLLVHLAAAAWAVVVLGGMPALQLGATSFDLGLAGDVAAVLGIAYALNIFNFMDGIDGLAASQAAFVCLLAPAVALLLVSESQATLPAAIVGAASLGFLAWNWPAARVFLGDVGSGYLGYAIAVLALVAARETPAVLWVWLILSGAFLADATTTLLRRLLRGKRVHEAHRTHAYQRLSRRWHGHAPVTKAVLLINCLWLLPLAVLAAFNPEFAAWIVVTALVPLVAIVLVIGAGKDDDDGSDSA